MDLRLTFHDFESVVLEKNNFDLMPKSYLSHEPINLG